MNVIKELPNEIYLSIHNFFHTKLSFYVQKTFQDTKILREHEPFLCWYMDWVSFISCEEKDVWKKVKRYKNNLSFINLVFQEFEKELNNYYQLEAQPLFSSHLRDYYQYANELCIEAYGEQLQKKTYVKSELLSIIKDCEKVIKNNFLNHKRPSHNIVILH